MMNIRISKSGSFGRMIMILMLAVCGCLSANALCTGPLKGTLDGRPIKMSLFFNYYETEASFYYLDEGPKNYIKLYGTNKPSGVNTFDLILKADKDDIDRGVFNIQVVESDNGARKQKMYQAFGTWTKPSGEKVNLHLVEE